MGAERLEPVSSPLCQAVPSDVGILFHSEYAGAGAIVTNIDHVQEQTARILQEQERDLLRAFRARLFDLQTELEKEKSR